MPKGIDGSPLWRRAAPLLACLLLALVTVAFAAGCGNSGESDSGSTGSTTAARARTRVVKVQPVRQDRFTYARARFNEMCAGCHTLADAGARGRRFNLDATGGDSETHMRFAIAEGEPGMPAWRDVLSPREYEELVTYLVAVMGRSAGNDYWGDQLKLRGEGAVWSRADTKRLEAYALRLVREKSREE